MQGKSGNRAAKPAEKQRTAPFQSPFDRLMVRLSLTTLSRSTSLTPPVPSLSRGGAEWAALSDVEGRLCCCVRLSSINMITALLPVKTFSRSKDRLAGLLTPSERAKLARAMFEDVWDTLRGLVLQKHLERLLVVSAEPYVIARCRKLRVSCLEEKEQLSHSDSVSRPTKWAIGLGATSLLSLAIDTPAVTAAEIVSLLRLLDSFPVVVVPSADGLGTNALLRTPPDAIEPCFGPESCRLHVQ